MTVTHDKRAIRGDAIAPASTTDRPRHDERLAWLDLCEQSSADLAPILDAAARCGVAGVVRHITQDLPALPASIRRIGVASSRDDVTTDTATQFDAIAIDVSHRIDLPLRPSAAQRCDIELIPYVDVCDAATLDVACTAVRTAQHTLLRFRDPTKIPLEIVLATGDSSSGRTVTMVHDVEEAGVVLGVLERGSDGVCLAPANATVVDDLAELCRTAIPRLALVEFEVRGVAHVGLGDRACVDTCTYLEKDEGILVGSFANTMLLACSETHPLPYMPTRPFRVNAGAIHSYTLAPGNRTRYLSELVAGSTLLAVRCDGRARQAITGRVKIERRPLLSIFAVAPSGEEGNIIVQDDWHVRMLGPAGTVHNVTELTAGDRLLGYLGRRSRHVGLPVDEFCQEQ